MSDEDIGMEKQIINMIKDVLIDEEADDDHINDQSNGNAGFNLKLLDLTSPTFVRKFNSDLDKLSNRYSIPNGGNINMKPFVEVKSDLVEKSPKGYHVLTSVFPSERTFFLSKLNSISNDSSVPNTNYTTSYYDYTNIFVNNSLSSNYDINTVSKFKKIRNRGMSEESTKVIMENDDGIEAKMAGLENISEDVYEKLKGSFLEIVTNQNCSRILQNCLQNIPDSILSKILIEVSAKINELMIDLYANYFFQKFYGVLNDTDRLYFLNQIKDHIVSISNNKIGTYPLQAVIDKMRTNKEREILVESVKNSIMEMCQDQNGVHVIEKMILCFQEEEILVIYETLIQNFEVLANNANGLCVAKLIILTKNNENLKILHSKIVENALVLVQNPYGNYAIQKALENWKTEDLEPLIKQFCNKFYDLSKHKYSSNAVEKSLDRGGESIMVKFIDEISYMNRVVDLMKNEYGNFVIQKALKLSQNLNRKRLVKLIQKNVEKIGDKKLILKWKNIVNSFCNTSYSIRPVQSVFAVNTNQNFVSAQNLPFVNNIYNNNQYISKAPCMNNVNKIHPSIINVKSLSTTNLTKTLL